MAEYCWHVYTAEVPSQLPHWRFKKTSHPKVTKSSRLRVGEEKFLHNAIHVNIVPRVGINNNNSSSGNSIDIR